MCASVIVVVHPTKYGPRVTVQLPPEANPSMAREARDQAIGAYTEALQAMEMAEAEETA